MKHANGLVESLNGFLNWNKARVTCFAKMLLAMISVKTVNLQEIAVGFSSSAQVTSRYRRLQKFFALFEIDFLIIARWIFTLFFTGKDKYYLTIDRTNWYWGKKKINIFMLSIAYEGQAIPLFWHLLDKGGSSNLQEQKALIRKFITHFGTKGVEGLLADREFASGKLFKWLQKNAVSFYIRIKENSQIYVKNKKLMSAKKLFSGLKPKEQAEFNMDVTVFGAKVFLAGSRSEKGELMIVATDKDPRNAIARYLRRWEIENLFQCLKGRGFRFEETHITHQDRIAKLIALLAVGFCWAHKVGEWRALKKPIITKKFANFQTPQQTFFRYGLDYIRDAILHIYDKNKQIQLKDCIDILRGSPPKNLILEAIL